VILLISDTWVARITGIFQMFIWSTCSTFICPFTGHLISFPLHSIRISS
jgi:hypothetical protein